MKPVGDSGEQIKHETARPYCNKNVNAILGGMYCGIPEPEVIVSLHMSLSLSGFDVTKSVTMCSVWGTSLLTRY